MKNTSNRRNFLKTAGATLVAASLPAAAVAQKPDEQEEAAQKAQPIYLNGCAWNRNLPGVFGLACYSFDARATVGGTGFGTIRDDVYTEINSQFAIDSVERRGKVYTLAGEIIASRSPELIGLRVRVVAESLGDGLGRGSITIESENDNLVVIAIIVTIMGLLLPAVQ